MRRAEASEHAPIIPPHVADTQGMTRFSSSIAAIRRVGKAFPSARVRPATALVRETLQWKSLVKCRLHDVSRPTLTPESGRGHAAAITTGTP